MTTPRTGTVTVQPVDDPPQPSGRLDRWRQDEWTLGVLHAPLDRLLDIGATFDVTWLSAPRKDTFLADPFPLGDDDVLCEEFTYRDASARLVRATTTDGAVTGVRPVECAVEHVSYPFVVHHEGAVYVVPERSYDGGIHLYRFDGADGVEGAAGTDRLTHVACLVPDVAALDTTLVSHEGRWYAFAGLGGARAPELSIWHADDLFGPWRPHPASPRRGAGPVYRPAGPLVRIGDALVRPSQDCTGTYGRRVLLNRVVALDADSFDETPAAALAVTAGPVDAGLHTLVPRRDGFLVDGKTRRLRVDALAGRVRRKNRRKKARSIDSGATP